MDDPQKKYMEMAIEEAVKAKSLGDYAIGAVIVGDDLIARAANKTKINQDATDHAEIMVIRKASKILKRRYMSECVIYTTHEPCPMCAGAIHYANLKGIVYGARMEDMAAYRKSNSNKDYLWRTMGHKAIDIFKNVPNKPFIVEFMRDECKELFHN